MSDLTSVRTPLTGLGLVTGTALTTVSGGICTVVIGDTSIEVNTATDIGAVSVGDVLLVARQGSARFAISRLFSAPAEQPNDPAPPPKPKIITGSLVVAPVYTGSFRDGSWRTDRREVIQGLAPGSSFGNNTGAAFYGSKPRSLSGATVTKATIRVRRERGGDFAARTATLRLVTEATKPSGAPTLGSSTTGPTLAIDKTDNDFVIPDSWAQNMVDGTKGGLAIFSSDGSPYMVFAGKDIWSPAWTMTIFWKRVT